MIRLLIFYTSFICAVVAHATEYRTDILLFVELEEDDPLEGWQDFRQNSPPNSRFGALSFESLHENKTSNPNFYYSALDPTFGVTIPLLQAYTINKDTLSVEIRARVRCNGRAQTAGLDLSSRLFPGYPYQYSQSIASGFGVEGYQHSNNNNLIYFYHQAEAPQFFPVQLAFAPLDSRQHRWHEWELIYEHKPQRLIFRLNGREVTRADNVNLDGVRLNTLWLKGGRAGSDYDDLIVQVFERP